MLLTSLILGLLYWQWQPMTGVVWAVGDSFWGPVLWIVFSLGWAIVLIATINIGHFELFGLQQVIQNLSRKEPAATQFKQPCLYKWVRHPIMLGFIIAFWATPMMPQAISSSPL